MSKRCLLVLLICASSAWGDEKADAMAVLDAFMAAFNSRDFDAWSETLNYPHVRFASGTVTVYPDAAAFKDRPDAFERLAATGWHHSRWISREVVMSAPEKVHINTVFRRFDAQDQPIATYQSLYIVTRQDGRWGIQARSSLAP